MNWKRFTEILKDQFRRERPKVSPHPADEWSGEILEEGGFVHSDPIITFDEVPLMQAMASEEGPKFKEGEWVDVNSKVYGRWLGRVESRQRVGNHWRYTIVSDGLLIFFQPPEQGRELHRRHHLVPESILERQTGYSAPTGSAEAYAVAFELGKGIPLGTRGIGGLWGFSNPPSSLAGLKAWAEEHGKEWTSPAAQTQYMMEHFGRTGGLIVLPVTEDQSKGLAHSSKDQLEPLHREFLLTIDHLIHVVGDVRFAEKMRLDLMDLWGEEKVAKGMLANEVLGMNLAEYARWLLSSSKESSQ